MLDIIRIGRFTSSNIFKLMTEGKGELGFGAPAMKYIHQKRTERKLGRGVEMNVYSRAIAWGEFVEGFLFSEKIGTEYEIISKETFQHPEIKGWVGSPDMRTKDSVSEIKCYEPQNFADYSDALKTNNTEVLKKDFPKEYWQIVSNCILLNKPFGEGIVYMPYLEDLNDIRIMVDNYEGVDLWKYRYIIETDDDNLPHLANKDHYTDIVSFRFKVPEQDKIDLTESVKRAITLLEK